MIAKIGEIVAAIGVPRFGAAHRATQAGFAVRATIGDSLRDDKSG
jgi:hypothetical protein